MSMDAASPQPPSALEDLDMLNILSHPIVATRVSELRSKDTSAARVRQLIAEITTSLGMEASRWVMEHCTETLVTVH